MLKGTKMYIIVCNEYLFYDPFQTQSVPIKDQTQTLILFGKNTNPQRGTDLFCEKHIFLQTQSFSKFLK